MTISQAAAITAVRAAATAGKQAVVVTAERTVTGTVRWADSDRARLLILEPIIGQGGQGTGQTLRITDANGAGFYYFIDPASGQPTLHDDAGTATTEAAHPRPWTYRAYSSGDLATPDEGMTKRGLLATFIDLSAVLTITTATANADPTVGTVLVSTAAGTHRERDPGWTYGTGLE